MSTEPIFTAWITAHALTKGIRQIRATVCADINTDMIADNDAPGRWGYYYHGEGTDWHRTFESALARAEKMRTAEIANLKKQIAKLEKMTFQDPSEQKQS